MSLLLTVLSGIFVFVFSQFTLKLLLEPVVELKKTLGEISALLLREQSRITNCVECGELKKDFKQVSSALLAKSYAIPFYAKLADFLKLPAPSNILEASRALNLISYAVTPGNKKVSHPTTAIDVHEQLKVIKSKLNVPVSYSEL